MTFRVKFFSEQKKRQRIAYKEYSRNILKAVLYDRQLDYSLRSQSNYKLINLRRSLAIRAKNRCLYTNRAKSVIRFFGMSRIVFRYMAREGRLLGVKRSSW